MSNNQSQPDDPDLTETKKLGHDLKIAAILGSILAFFALLGVLWSILKWWSRKSIAKLNEKISTSAQTSTAQTKE